ncbi:MAG TPA: porphobilinogen synthase [Chitinispirillaceae bacterium]|nr:porphobilinogen synthase [Chitinispirillaceae bacterium]
MRRLRSSELIRSMVQETRLSPADLIMPLFICPGNGVKTAIRSMPGVYRMSIDHALFECHRILDLGIRNVLLFGIPENKDDTGEIGADENGIVQKAIRALKREFEDDLLVISDVCNCEYTTHGHCGIVVNGKVDNQLTLSVLAKQALSHAHAGADIVAPSDMMDGRVAAIRKALDLQGFSDIPIMSYAVKYASAFYGPFRDAADCAPKFGDRKSYQMNPANSIEAFREVELDIEEGADIIMIKPALCYLDIIQRIKNKFNVPVAAYNVSGEYSMVKAAAEKGWIDQNRVIMEILISIKRAGAGLIISYHADQACELLQQEMHR